MQEEYLEKLIATDYKLITIETAATKETIRDFTAMVREGKAIYAWKEDEGLYRLEASHIYIPKTKTPEMILKHIQKSKHYGVYLLVDFQQYISEPKLYNLAKQISDDKKSNKTIIFINNFSNYSPSLLEILLITQEVDVKKSTLFTELF